MSKPETSKTQTSEPKKNAELAKDFNAAFKNFDKDGSGNDSRFSNNLGFKDYQYKLLRVYNRKNYFAKLNFKKFFLSIYDKSRLSNYSNRFDQKRS